MENETNNSSNHVVAEGVESDNEVNLTGFFSVADFQRMFGGYLSYEMEHIFINVSWHYDVREWTNVCEIGIEPVKPAEVIILRITQKNRE